MFSWANLFRPLNWVSPFSKDDVWTCLSCDLSGTYSAPETVIFDGGAAYHVVIRIFNALGQEIRTLID